MRRTKLHLTNNASSSAGGKGPSQAGAPGSSSHHARTVATHLPSWAGKTWY